ncbi:MAG: MFS transporter [Candidatus Uhrbacteria bacterium]
MNPILRILIITDVLALSGLGLISPIMAIFIERNVAGSVAVIGFAQMIYMIVKSVLQLGVGWFNDRDRVYLREFWTSLAGYAIIAIVPFCYLAVRSVPALYAAQALLGIGAALAYPGWMVIFTKFVDAQREGREWTTYSTLVFIGMAIAAAVGGWTVERFGFRPVLIGWGVLSVLGCLAFASLLRSYPQLCRDHHPPRHYSRDVPPVK